jgi:LAO/AO transport system kinase
MLSDKLTAQQYFEGIRNGDTVLLSRAITLLESTLPAHRILANELLQLCLPFSGGSLRIGITGVPGAGKSTFIEKLGQIIVAEGKRLAVLAIDPSSRKTRGSILGDKTRMETLSQDTSVFIRPSPAGSALGGVGSATREIILVLEAAGYDYLFVETVGVGQSEVAVYGMTDIFLLLLIAGAGDELQGIKRGIMEMADIIAVNKADGENIQRANATRMDFKRALHLFRPAESGWTPAVTACSALTGDGLAEIRSMLLDYETTTRNSGYFEAKRKQQLVEWFDAGLQEQIVSRFRNNPDNAVVIERLREQVVNGSQLPTPALSELWMLLSQ